MSEYERSPGFDEAYACEQRLKQLAQRAGVPEATTKLRGSERAPQAYLELQSPTFGAIASTTKKVEMFLTETYTQLLNGSPERQQRATQAIYSVLTEWNPALKHAESEWKEPPTEFVTWIQSVVESAMGDQRVLLTDLLWKGLKPRLPLLRREFKLHLNPTREARHRVIADLESFLRSHPDVLTQLSGIKYTLGTERATESTRQIADVVLYLSGGETVDTSLAQARSVAGALVNAGVAQNEGAEAVGPRWNYPITRMLHVAQSSGDLKKSFSRMDQFVVPTELRDGKAWHELPWNTLAEALYDKEQNMAFFHKDTEAATEAFNSLKTE